MEMPLLYSHEAEKKENLWQNMPQIMQMHGKIEICHKIVESCMYALIHFFCFLRHIFFRFIATCVRVEMYLFEAKQSEFFWVQVLAMQKVPLIQKCLTYSGCVTFGVFSRRIMISIIHHPLKFTCSMFMYAKHNKL